MRRTTITYLCALGFLVGLGCSSEEPQTEAEETTTPEAVADDSPMTHDPNARTTPVRDEGNAIVTLRTNFGLMTLELWRDVAPAHADSFLSLTEKGFYDNTIFHRVLPEFVIQGGDPTGSGMGNAGYLLDAEFSDLPHQEGTLSMARGPDPNSASCQFFICLSRERTAVLDGQYTVFGQLLKGYEVLQQIATVPTVAQPGGQEISRPAEDVRLIEAYVSDADGNRLDS